MVFVLDAPLMHSFFWVKLVSIAIFHKYKPLLIDVDMLIETIVETIVICEILYPL